MSRSEACCGSGLFRFEGLGDPKLVRYCEPSVAKSSAKKKLGLFAASTGKLVESKNSKSGSESRRPNISESRMNGGELAEYTASAEVCMTFLNVHRRVALISSCNVYVRISRSNREIGRCSRKTLSVPSISHVSDAVGCNHLQEYSSRLQNIVAAVSGMFDWGELERTVSGEHSSPPPRRVNLGRLFGLSLRCYRMSIPVDQAIETEAATHEAKQVCERCAEYGRRRPRSGVVEAGKLGGQNPR